jgi:hypothetical protein
MLFTFLILAPLALCGCASWFSSFSSQESVGSVYYADFPDVPIPSEMRQNTGRSQVGKSSGGNAIGYLEFSGSVAWDSLVNACASNLTRDGWSVMGLFRGERSLIVADKRDRVCVISIFDGFPSTTMSVWVTDKTFGFVAPLAAPERIGTGSDDTHTTTTGSGSSAGSSVDSSGLREQGLSE